MLPFSNMLAAEQSAIFGPPSSVRSKSCVSAAAGCPFRLLAAPLKSFAPFKAAVDVRSQHIQRNRGQLITCKAGPSGRTAHDGASVQIPQSEDESITQAIAALSIKMGQGKKGGKPMKGFKSGSQRRLSIQIPLRDESAKADVKLATRFLEGLPPEVSRPLVLFFGKVDAALEASKQFSNQVYALDDVPDEAPAAPVLIIGASQEQLPEAEGLVSKTRAKAVVLLNAQWTDTKSVPSRHGSFVGSFETVYCFQPIAIRAFVISTTQGALFAQATRGDSHADWKILKKGWGDSWKVIGKMQRRPTSQDLETAFYNASAAGSPLTAGIKAARQLVPSKKDAK